MLPLEERYSQLYKNFEKKEYQENLTELLSIAIENRKVIKETKKILTNSYDNKILKDKLIILFISILYDNENSAIIGNTIKELIKDEDFKTQIIKIIKTEKDSKKIFKLLKNYFMEKFDKRFDDFFKIYLTDKLLCQYNIDLAFKVMSENILTKEINVTIENYYKENKLPEKYIDKLKQKLVALPYDYSIDKWFKKFYKKSSDKIKKIIIKEENYNIFINHYLENLILETIYSTINNDSFLKKFKKEFHNEFLSDNKTLKKLLKSLLFDSSDLIFNKIKEKRYNCFHLTSKMFRIDKELLSLYLKEILKKKELEEKILPVLYENLK